MVDAHAQQAAHLRGGGRRVGRFTRGDSGWQQDFKRAWRRRTTTPRSPHHPRRVLAISTSTMHLAASSLAHVTAVALQQVAGSSRRLLRRRVLHLHPLAQRPPKGAPAPTPHLRTSSKLSRALMQTSCSSCA